LAAPIKIPCAALKSRQGAFGEEQLEAFYVELRAPLSYSLRRWKLPAEEIEDIVHETFLRLLSHGPEDLKVENARFWLFRVAHNIAIDRRRSGWANFLDSQANFDNLLSARPSPSFNPEKIYLDREQWQVVQDNLALLTPLQRQAIYMRIIGLSHKAIAVKLKGTTKSVAELIRRGLKRLQEKGTTSRA
jgi:RNA polymerase sigma factor (sigma-70 family)